MKPTHPLPLYHSWPLFESGCRLDLGMSFGLEAQDASNVAPPASDPSGPDVGRWSCDLADSSLAWTGPVFDLFGLPREARLSRDEIVAFYCEESRAAMERLRAYAIKHRRGFTVDVEIRAGGISRRWMRLLAAPVCRGDRVIRLEGLKQDISREYTKAARH